MAKKKFKIDISPIDSSTEDIDNSVIASDAIIEDSTTSEPKEEVIVDAGTPSKEENSLEEHQEAEAKTNLEDLPEISNNTVSIAESSPSTEITDKKDPTPMDPQPIASVPSLDQLTQNLYEKAQIEQQIREQAITHAPSVLSAFRISTDISDAIEYIDKKYDSIKISELVDRLLRNSLEMFYAEDFEYAKAHPYSRDPFTGKRLNADGTQKHTKKTKRRRTTKA